MIQFHPVVFCIGKGRTTTSASDKGDVPNPAVAQTSPAQPCLRPIKENGTNDPRHERGLYCTAGQAILASEKRHCEGEQVRPCRVHIALHGCQQDVGDVGKLYVDDSGYNAWADTNRIIVLYPQTTAKAVNPQACSDWWSYVTHSDSYVDEIGLQVKAIEAMLDAWTAAARPAQRWWPPPAGPLGGLSLRTSRYGRGPGLDAGGRRRDL